MHKSILCFTIAIAVSFTGLAIPKVEKQAEISNEASDFDIIEQADYIDFQMAALNSCVDGEKNMPAFTPVVGGIPNITLSGAGEKANIDYGFLGLNTKITADAARGAVDYLAADYSIGFIFQDMAGTLQLGGANAILFDNNLPYKIAVKGFTNGIIGYTVIESEEAPDCYTVMLDLPSGYRLDWAVDQWGVTDGSVQIFNHRDEIVGGIGLPKAYSADGSYVPVELAFNGRELTYKYDIGEAYTAFPVVGIMPMDAASDWNAHYKPLGNGTRGWHETYDATYGRSLCFYPLYGQANWGSNMSTSTINTKWNALYNYFGPDSQWYNYTGMRDQFNCHCNWYSVLSVLNDEWNLEPGRPADVAATIANKCNPT